MKVEISRRSKVYMFLGTLVVSAGLILYLAGYSIFTTSSSSAHPSSPLTSSPLVTPTSPIVAAKPSTPPPTFIPITTIPPLTTPPTRFQYSYDIESSYMAPDHSYFTASLKFAGSETYHIKHNNNMIHNLNFTYFFISPEHLVVRITDKEKERFEVPHADPFPHVDYAKKFAPLENALVTVQVTEKPFTYRVIRKKTGEVIFDSSVAEFIYSDFYIQMSTSLATPNIFGLGERAFKLNLGPDGTYSIFNKDLPWQIDDGTPGNNLYGYHPVYLLREKSNSFSAALMRSSVPMDVQLEGGKKLTYKVLGGIIDFNFFVGTHENANPETVIKQYHTYLGGWTLQPFWSFGFHQCRWGYENHNMLESVLRGYKEHNLPLDVIWSDIDYMERKIDFTIDEWNFPADKMKNMIQSYKKRWVPIIDAGIAVNNDIYNKGRENGVYVKNPDGSFLRGQVWPGEVNYPDFFHPKASEFWSYGLDLLHKKVPFDGIWLDMNEVSNFVPGAMNFYPSDDDILNNPVYLPAKSNQKIYTMTMRMDAVHHGGIQEHYAHNMFGHMESKATYEYLTKNSDLAFILTRASFYGTGKWAAHWTGDNAASWEFLQISIPTVITSGIFGMPMAGADICGFKDHTTEELCSRWMQLGTLYPFARNHNKEDAKSQEPYALGHDVLEVSRVTLNFRYSILRHYYAQFLKQGGTGTIFRPLFFEFPNDDKLYQPDLKIVDTQFLIGECLMIAPALEQFQREVNAYFPKDTWFNFKTGELMNSWRNEAKYVKIPAPLMAITAPMFIRGGHMVATQDTTGVMRTDDLSNVYRLNIAFKDTEKKTSQSSRGTLIGISNFEDRNVLNKCKNSNCLYIVHADISILDHSYSLTVSFAAQGPHANYESVKVSELVVMGDFGLDCRVFSTEFKTKNARVEVVNNHLIKYVFDQPFEVRPDAKIDISGVRDSHNLRPSTEQIKD